MKICRTIVLAAAALASVLSVSPAANAGSLQQEWFDASGSAAAGGISGYEVLGFRPGVDIVAVVYSDQPSEHLLINTDSDDWVEYSYKSSAGSSKVELGYVVDSPITMVVNNVEIFRAEFNSASGWTVVLDQQIQDPVTLTLLQLIYDLALDENLSPFVDIDGAMANFPDSLCSCGGEAGDGSPGTVTPPAGPWVFQPAGACIAPIWAGGRIRFIGCTDLSGWCLMPENSCTLNCNFGTGSGWHGGDGLRAPWHGPGQSLKVPGHCSLTVDCGAQTVTCCCNAFLSFVQRKRGKIPSCQEMDSVANPNDPNHAHCAVPLVVN